MLMERISKEAIRAKEYWRELDNLKRRVGEQD